MTTYTPEFLVQDNFGSVCHANAYITVEWFLQYCTNKGIDVTQAPYSDEALCQVAIIAATQYMDYRWQYFGMRCQITQGTEWPRYTVINNDRNPVDGIVPPLMRACSEYAILAITGTNLFPVPTRDPTGQGVASKTTQVGPIMTSTKYIGGTAIIKPVYPIPDGILQREGYIIGGSSLIRG